MVTVMVIPYDKLTCCRDLYPYLNEYATRRIRDIKCMMASLTRYLPINARACSVDKYGCRYHALVVMEILMIREILQKLVDEGQFLFDLLRTCTHLDDDEHGGDPVMQCAYLIANPDVPDYGLAVKSGSYASEFFLLEEMLYDYERLESLTC